jgi:hypothetical protein
MSDGANEYDSEAGPRPSDESGGLPGTEKSSMRILALEGLFASEPIGIQL